MIKIMMMKKVLAKTFWFFAFICMISIAAKSQKHILVFSATKAFRHASIPAGKIALMQIGANNHWIVDTTEDPSVFTKKGLRKYKVIVFLSTTGNIFNDEQKEALQHYIRKGGGYVGIHAATDTEHDWPWYNDLVGAYFKNHPKPQSLKYDVIDKNFPATSFMPDTMRRFEEIYNFDSFKKEAVHVLITADEKTYTGGTMKDFHPAAWYHEFEGGRVFYTAWGHAPETFKEPLFIQQLTEAIKWAMHEN